jgi:hypothetical protein
MRTEDYHAPGMRHLRLVLWTIYNRTPLDQDIDGQTEQAGAAKCKLPWRDYLALKAAHPDLWLRAAEKRQRAVVVGHFPPQPWQLREYRKTEAPMKAIHRRPRPRFYEWAGKKLVRQRRFKYPGLRRRVVDRLFLRLIGQ